MRRFFAIFTAAFTVLLFNCTAEAGQTILVSAAASLSDAFTVIGGAFTADNPDVKVEFNFAASGALLAQMELGAPVDVFASADIRTMEKAEDKGLVAKDSVTAFATNSLVIIKPAGSGADVSDTKGLLSGKIVRVAVGNPNTVPAGGYARAALISAGVWDGIQGKLVLAENVRQVLDYVRRGEVDAGVVYATDAARAGKTVTVVSRLDTGAPVSYPAAVTHGSAAAAAAKRFVEYLSGDKAAAVLKKFGFGRPNGRA